MPYKIKVSTDPACAVSQEFDPEINTDLKLALTFGTSPGPNREFTEPLRSEDLAAIAAMPRTLLVGKRRRGGIPHIHGWYTGPWIVSERVCELIEGLEPGVHEFVPIEVKSVDRKTRHGTYYVILLTQTLDAIVAENDDGIYVLKASAIRGRHLWRGVPPNELKYFCSDELRDQLQAERRDGWDFERCIVRDQ